MADRYQFPFVRKVMVVSIALWTIGCAYMLWSMRSSSRGLVPFFLILYVLPLAIMLGLLAISWWYDSKEPLEPPSRRGTKGSPKARKIGL